MSKTRESEQVLDQLNPIAKWGWKLQLWCYSHPELRAYLLNYGSWDIYKRAHPENIDDLAGAAKDLSRGSTKLAVAVTGIGLTLWVSLLGIVYGATALLGMLL